MTTIAWPSGLVPAEQDWGLVSNTAEMTSPLSGSIQTQEWPGARWMASMTFNGLTGAPYREAAAFFTKLRGRANRVALRDYGYTGARGAATGTPVVNGAGQTGASLNVSGFTPGVTNILRAGDYFQVGVELKLVVADANSDGGGLATLVFEPPLRAAPANGAGIVTAAPAAIMMLKQDGFEIRTIGSARDLHYITANFEEAWP